ATSHEMGRQTVLVAIRPICICCPGREMVIVLPAGVPGGYTNPAGAVSATSWATEGGTSDEETGAPGVAVGVRRRLSDMGIDLPGDPLRDREHSALADGGESVRRGGGGAASAGASARRQPAGPRGVGERGADGDPAARRRQWRGYLVGADRAVRDRRPGGEHRPALDGADGLGAARGRP